MMESVTIQKEELGDMEDVQIDGEEQGIPYAEINGATKSDDNNGTATPEGDEDEDNTVTVPQASPEENEWIENPILGSEKVNKEALSRRRMLAFVVVLAWVCEPCHCSSIGAHEH